MRSPCRCPEETIFSKTNGYPCSWIPPHCYLLHQTLSQCNKTNISHLTTDAFPLGFKTHSPQLARPEEILISLSQDMFCKESGPPKRVAAPGGLFCCFWSVTATYININGDSVCTGAAEKACVRAGHVAVMGREAPFMCSVL